MEPSRPSGASLAPVGPAPSLPQHRLPPGHLQDWSPPPACCQLSAPARFTPLRGCWPCPHPQRVRNRKNVQSQPIPECCAQDCFTNKRWGSAGPEWHGPPLGPCRPKGRRAPALMWGWDNCQGLPRAHRPALPGRQNRLHRLPEGLGVERGAGPQRPQVPHQGMHQIVRSPGHRG